MINCSRENKDEAEDIFVKEKLQFEQDKKIVNLNKKKSVTAIWVWFKHT